jgi:hypothetical protein
MDFSWSGAKKGYIALASLLVAVTATATLPDWVGFLVALIGAGATYLAKNEPKVAASE